MRKKIFKKMIKGVSCVALALAVTVTGSQLPGVLSDVVAVSQTVKAATATNRVPMVCYTRNSGNLNTYTDSSLTRKTGYICSYDQCTILNVYSNGAVRVRYPVAGGTKTAYAAASGFFQDTDFSTATMKLGVGKTAYRKSSGNATIGSVYASDDVVIVGHENGRTEVIYPTSSGYKLGWVVGTYNVSSSVSSPATVSNGVYLLASAIDTNYVADIYGGLNANGANCQLYKKHGLNSQRFEFILNSDGYYTIKNVGSGKVLDCAYSGTVNETNVWQYASNSTAAQRWKLSDAGNGYYVITCKCNGLALDVWGGMARNENNIQMYKYSGGINQKWKLISAGSGDSMTSSVNESLAAKIVAYELSQVGTGDRKGDNNVECNTWYYGHPVSGNGYAWCMAFQAYACYQITGSNNAIPKTAGCTTAVNIYKQRGQFKYSKYYGGNYTPKAGDLVFYTENYGALSSHVGMITGTPVNGYLQTVEGNIWCSDGNWKVVKFTNNAKRTVSNSYVLGYVTPNY